MKVISIWLLACVAVPSLCLPFGTAYADSGLSVTIYNNDQALIQDTRQIDLPAGRSRQEFPGVSAAIRPETVTLSAAGTTIVEQNFDYDLLSPAALMAKSIGGPPVTVIRTNPATGVETTESAQVLAMNMGTLLRIGNRIETLENYGARVVFSELPKNLRASPTLSVTLEAKSGGTRPVTLNYLSRGMNWKADYVALFEEKSGKLDMQGWITLINNSGSSFPNANVYLVAGSPGSDRDENGNQRYSSSNQRVSGNRPGTESAGRERLGDFYVYPLAGRTTVAAAQQKQASFLDVTGASATRGYFFRNDWLGKLDEPASFATVLRFSNTAAAGGLGDALPAGTVRVYMRDARGQPQFVGENRIDHTPMGSQVAIKIGEAFDVKVLPTVEKRDRITTDEWEQSSRYRIRINGGTYIEVQRDDTRTYYRTSMAYRITNAKPEPVTVEVVQGGLDDGRWHETRVPSETIKGEQRSLDERTWLVTVPANGETTLKAQFDTRY